MMAALTGGLVALAVLGLGFYVVSIMRPRRFLLWTNLLRGVFSFHMEIESSGEVGKRSGRAGRGLGPASPESEDSDPAGPGE
jgi:hypothetical protein